MVTFLAAIGRCSPECCDCRCARTSGYISANMLFYSFSFKAVNVAEILVFAKVKEMNDCCDLFGIWCVGLSTVCAKFAHKSLSYYGFDGARNEERFNTHIKKARKRGCGVIC